MTPTDPPVSVPEATPADRIQQSIRDGEAELASGAGLVSLDSIAAPVVSSPGADRPDDRRKVTDTLMGWTDLERPDAERLADRIIGALAASVRSGEQQ